MKSHFRFILLSLNKLLCMLRLYSISPTPKTRYKLFSRHINAVSLLECGASRTALNFLECGTSRAALIYSDSVTSPYRCSPPPSDKTTCIATFRNTMMVMLHLKNICFCTRIVQANLYVPQVLMFPKKQKEKPSMKKAVLTISGHIQMDWLGESILLGLFDQSVPLYHDALQKKERMTNFLFPLK